MLAAPLSHGRFYSPSHLSCPEYPPNMRSPRVLWEVVNRRRERHDWFSDKRRREASVIKHIIPAPVSVMIPAAPPGRVTIC